VVDLDHQDAIQVLEIIIDNWRFLINNHGYGIQSPVCFLADPGMQEHEIASLGYPTERPRAQEFILGVLEDPKESLRPQTDLRKLITNPNTCSPNTCSQNTCSPNNSKTSLPNPNRQFRNIISKAQITQSRKYVRPPLLLLTSFERHCFSGDIRPMTK
jgi:hypothetical protein